MYAAVYDTCYRLANEKIEMRNRSIQYT